MLNQCIFEGRLVADPEFKRTASGMSICNFKIAVDRTIKKEGKPALFLPVTFYGSTADNASKYLRKGRAVIAIGRLENDEYTDKATNEKKTIIFLNGSSFEFPLTEKNSKEQAPQGQELADQGFGAPMPSPIKDSSGLDNIDVVDDDLPF